MGPFLDTLYSTSSRLTAKLFQAQFRVLEGCNKEGSSEGGSTGFNVLAGDLSMRLRGSPHPLPPHYDRYHFERFHSYDK